jgi:hypothetical protein
VLLAIDEQGVVSLTGVDGVVLLIPISNIITLSRIELRKVERSSQLNSITRDRPQLVLVLTG